MSELSRVKRVTINSVLPTDANDFVGTINIEVAELNEIITLTYQAPEVNNFFASAIDAGLRARIGIRVSSAKASPVTESTPEVTLPEAIKAAVVEEVATLQSGKYITRANGTGTAAKTEFTDAVVAKAIELTFPGVVTVTAEMYSEVKDNLTLLNSVQKEYDAFDVAGKREFIKSVAKTAKAVGYFKLF